MVKSNVQVTKTPRQHLVPPSKAGSSKPSRRTRRSTETTAAEKAAATKRTAIEAAREAKRAELESKQREAEERRMKKKKEDAARRVANKNKVAENRSKSTTTSPADITVAETTATKRKRIRFSSEIPTVEAGEMADNSELETTAATEDETVETSDEAREDELTSELLYIPSPPLSSSVSKVEAPREAPLSKKSSYKGAKENPAWFTEVEAPREAPSSEKPVIIAQPTVLTEVPPNYKKRPSSTSRSGINISKKVKLPTDDENSLERRLSELDSKMMDFMERLDRLTDHPVYAAPTSYSSTTTPHVSTAAPTPFVYDLTRSSNETGNRPQRPLATAPVTIDVALQEYRNLGKLPRFEDRPDQDFNMWLGQLERHFHTRPFTDEAKKFILTSSVEGRASLALEGLRRIEEATYLDVVNRMKLVLYGHEHTSSIGNVFTLVQHDPADSFIVYAHKVRAMLKHCPEIARFDEEEVESFMIAAFIKGLSPERAEYVRTRTPKSMDEAAQIAARTQMGSVKKTSEKSVKFLQNMETPGAQSSTSQLRLRTDSEPPHSYQPNPPPSYQPVPTRNQSTSFPNQPLQQIVPSPRRYSSVGSRHSDHVRNSERASFYNRDRTSNNSPDQQRGCWNCGSLDHYRRSCSRPPRNVPRAPSSNSPLPTSFRVEHCYAQAPTNIPQPTSSTVVGQEPKN